MAAAAAVAAFVIVFVPLSFVICYLANAMRLEHSTDAHEFSNQRQKMTRSERKGCACLHAKQLDFASTMLLMQNRAKY